MRVGTAIFGRLGNSELIFGGNILVSVETNIDTIIYSLLNFSDAGGDKLTGLLILFLEDVVLEIKFIVGFFIIFNLVFVLLLFSLHLFNHMQ